MTCGDVRHQGLEARPSACGVHARDEAVNTTRRRARVTSLLYLPGVRLVGRSRSVRALSVGDQDVLASGDRAGRLGGAWADRPGVTSR